jgi:hypothetical protein
MIDIRLLNGMTGSNSFKYRKRLSSSLAWLCCRRSFVMESHICLVEYSDVNCGFGSNSAGQGCYSLLQLNAQILPKTSEPLALYNKSYDYT